MHELLNYHMVDSWYLDFQKKIQADLLNKYILDPDFREQLRGVDFNKTTFAPDLFCLYFTAKFNKTLHLKTLGYEMFMDVRQDVRIDVLDPIASPSDYYFSNLPEINHSSLDLSVPFIGSELMSFISNKIQMALKLLAPIKSSLVNSNLLNSIAIFLGNEQLSTAATILLAQGKIYIKYVGNEYPDLYYLDMMIHEISHLYFNLINYLYPTISDPHKMLFSVVKNVERPIFAIFHTAFVLYRLLSVYKEAESLLKSYEQPVNSHEKHSDYLYARFFKIPFNVEFRMELYRKKFDICFDQLLHSKALLPVGESLLIAMRDSFRGG